MINKQKRKIHWRFDRYFSHCRLYLAGTSFDNVSDLSFIPIKYRCGHCQREYLKVQERLEKIK